jgi:chromosome segregation ATPase
MKIKEFIDLAHNREEIEAAGDKLRELVSKKAEEKGNKRETEKELDQLQSAIIQMEEGEEKEQAYRKINELEGKVKFLEKAPSKYDEEIEKQEQKLREVEEQHYLNTKKVAKNEVIPKLAKEYIEVMEQVQDIEARMKKINDALTATAPQFNDRDRTKYAMLGHRIEIKPTEIKQMTDKSINRYKNSMKKRELL